MKVADNFVRILLRSVFNRSSHIGSRQDGYTFINPSTKISYIMNSGGNLLLVIQE